MAPMSQADRMERKIDKVLEEQAKIGRIVAVHGVKIANNEKEITAIKARAWVVITMVLGALVTSIASALSGKNNP